MFLKYYFVGVVFLMLPLWHKAQEVCFMGKIDKYPIVLELKKTEATYCYQHKLIDIEMEATQQGQKLELKVHDPTDQSIIDERFNLTFITPKLLKGTWTNGSKKLLVELNRVGDASEVKNQYEKFESVSNDLYRYIKHSLLQFKPTKKTTKIGGYIFQEIMEQRTQVAFPRLMTGLPPKQLAYINAQLQQLHLQYAADSYACASYKGNSEYEVQIHEGDIFINKQYFSLVVTNSYYCGGVHPDFSSIPYNFDLVNMKALETEEIVYFSKEALPAKNSDFWQTYQTNAFGPEVANLMVRYKAEAFKDTPDCNYADASIWHFSPVQITSKGIRFFPSFPRAMRSCDSPDWSVLSKQQLGSFYKL